MEPDKKKDEEKKKVSYKDTFKFIWYYVRGKKWCVIASVVFVMLAEFAGAVTPVYTGKIVDAMVQGADSAWDNVWIAFWCLVGFRVIQYIFTLVSELLSNRYSVFIMSNVAADMSYRVQRFSSEWHENSFGGATIRKVTRSMHSANQVLWIVIRGLLPTFFLIVGVLIVLASKIPVLGLAMGLIVILYIVVSLLMSVKILYPRYMKVMKKDNKISAVLGDAITANSIVKSFGAEKQEDDKLRAKILDWKTLAINVWDLAEVLSTIRDFISFSMVAVVLSIVIWEWKSGNATIGDITVVIAATSLILGHVRNVGGFITQLQYVVSEINDAVEVWLREDDVCDVEKAVPLVIKHDNKRNKIAFEDVGFIYPRSDVGLFKKLSVKITDGEHVALVGTSGSGKSTFIKLLQRMYNINEGQIRVDGQDISKVTLESLRQTISLVPQDPILFHRSLKENIAYGKPDASMEEIIEASKKAYIHDFISTLPKGYDTKVGERGVKLSGGERQRVAIARAILADKPILVLDEATSSLDSVSEMHIKRAMEELVKGKTTITIAHRLSTVKNSDRILVFSNGKIIEQGKHDELMKDAKSQYKTLYDTQSLGIVIRDDAVQHDT